MEQLKEHSSDPRFNSLQEVQEAMLFSDFHEVLDDILEYFLIHPDEESLIAFYQSLKRPDQKSFVEGLVNKAFWDKEIAQDNVVIQFRKEIAETEKYPIENVDVALKYADSKGKAFYKVLRFLKVSQKNLNRFINAVSKQFPPQKAKKVMNRILVELFNHIPHRPIEEPGV